MNNLIIKQNDTIQQALQKLQMSKKRFLICLDDSNSILGLLTDGDIRRGFLEGLTISDSIISAINKHFEYLNLESSFNEICDKFKSDKIDFLPMQKYSSWWRGAPAKGVGRSRGARVQIPLSPFCIPTKKLFEKKVDEKGI